MAARHSWRRPYLGIGSDLSITHGHFLLSPGLASGLFLRPSYRGSAPLALYGVPPDPPPRHLGTLRPRLRNPGAFLCRRGFSCARHATERFGTKFTSENWNCWRGGHPYTPVHPPRLLLKLGPAPTERGLFLRWRQSALVQVHQARPMNRPRC